MARYQIRYLKQDGVEPIFSLWNNTNYHFRTYKKHQQEGWEHTYIEQISCIMLIYHEFMGLTYVGRSTFFVFRYGLGQRPSTHPGKGMKHQSVVRIPRRLGPSWESSFSKQSWHAHTTLQYSERPFHFFFLSELDFQNTHVLKISKKFRRSQCYAIKFDSAQFFFIYIFLTLKQRTSVFERVNQGVIAISYYEKFSKEVTVLRKSLVKMTFFYWKWPNFEYFQVKNDNTTS